MHIHRAGLLLPIDPQHIRQRPRQRGVSAVNERITEPHIPVEVAPCVLERVLRPLQHALLFQSPQFLPELHGKYSALEQEDHSDSKSRYGACPEAVIQVGRRHGGVDVVVAVVIHILLDGGAVSLRKIGKICLRHGAEHARQANRQFVRHIRKFRVLPVAQPHQIDVAVSIPGEVKNLLPAASVRHPIDPVGHVHRVNMAVIPRPLFAHQQRRRGHRFPVLLHLRGLYRAAYGDGHTHGGKPPPAVGVPDIAPHFHDRSPLPVLYTVHIIAKVPSGGKDLCLQAGILRDLRPEGCFFPSAAVS